MAGKKYYVNWAKAYFYLIPQMPNHPNRLEVMKMMKLDEPRMIANFKMMSQLKVQVQAENPGLTEMQQQQMVMMKMQQHMMKNGPPTRHMSQAPPAQQKVVQLQMLAHIKMQFQSDA